MARAALTEAPPLRSELSSFSGLIVLGTLMDQQTDERAIAEMALDAVPSLGGIEAVAVELDGIGRVPSDAVNAQGTPLDERSLRTFPLATLRGTIGTLVVRDADGGTGVPDFPLEMLAHETARALVSARTRRALTASERSYRLLIESSQDVVLSIDAVGRLAFVSAAAERVLGYRPADLNGRDLIELAAPGHRIEVVEWLARCLTGSQAGAFETELRREDGTPLCVSVKGVATFDEDGRFAGVVATVADVSEQKHAELIERHLRHVQRLEAIGQLTAGIAHDFNNLLMSIFGYCDLAAARTVGDDSLVSDLGEIRTAAEHARDLTKQLLAFGRRQILRERTVSLGDVVRDAEPLLRRLLSEAVRIEIVHEAGRHTCLADPQALQQVLVNLCLNAQDALPSGGDLRITTCDASFAAGEVPRGLSAGDYCCLRVSDSGVGMDAATLERLFEPFFTTKPFGTSAGLGLSTSWGIVGQSGGTIAVESAPGEGSTFSVYLPAAAREETGAEA